MISSLDNKKVKEWTKLHNKKYRQDEYLILDENNVCLAYENNYLKTLIYCGEKPFEFADSFEVSQEVMNKIAKTDNLRIIGIGMPVKEKEVLSDRVLILEELQDPLNIGMCLNNAWLFGFEMVYLCGNCADIYHPKCLSNGLKALYNISIMHDETDKVINRLHDNGYKVYATGLKAYSKELYDVEYEDKMAFILGNEGSGVKESTFEISDEVVKIDMHNIDSLNVAMAGAIVMYHFGK
ncbi:MAG: TrmH family RNA methyltransferase [Erysipelotrichaceae bacterium]